MVKPVSYMQGKVISFFYLKSKPRLLLFRSSRPEVYYKKVVLRNFAKLQENTCARVSFLIKLQATLLKKRHWHRCFLVDFAKFLRTPFLQNTSGRLLLGLHNCLLLFDCLLLLDCLATSAVTFNKNYLPNCLPFVL